MVFPKLGLNRIGDIPHVYLFAAEQIISKFIENRVNEWDVSDFAGSRKVVMPEISPHSIYCDCRSKKATYSNGFPWASVVLPSMVNVLKSLSKET